MMNVEEAMDSIVMWYDSYMHAEGINKVIEKEISQLTKQK